MMPLVSFFGPCDREPRDLGGGRLSRCCGASGLIKPHADADADADADANADAGTDLPPARHRRRRAAKYTYERTQQQ